ncbi:MAG: extracellular solute-binding protein [Devosia sp.]|nr:extracellular solute-binding protein [Devosia sp.]
MNRRELLLAGTALAGATLLPRSAFADKNRIDVYINGDANISDFWSNVVKPGFEKANAGVTVNVVVARGDNGTAPIVARAMAALKSKQDPLVDLFEENDPLEAKGGIEAGLWADFSKAGLSNYAKVNPLAIQTPYGLPYRGSQVLLAYDTTKLPKDKVPKTFADLVTWIKANPGQFIYNRPDKGGSGGNFVRRAIHEANGRDPSKFTLDNYVKGASDELLAKGFAILQDLAPSLYEQGAYTSGNTQSLQLLAQGAVTMIPAWSDQALQSINQGVLPETTGLVQLTDLALCGGFSTSTVPTDAGNYDLALKLVDYVLSPEVQTKIVADLGGFPGIKWDFLPAELQAKYADVVPKSIPTFPGGDWNSAISDGWYRTVAPNVARS